MKPCEYGCGAEVRYVLLREVDGKKEWSPPMQLTAREIKKKRAKDFEYPPLVVTEVFVPHLCAKGAEAKEKRRLREQANFAMRRDRARVTEAAWEVALPRACPKCEAAPGARCINMSDYKWNKSPIREVVHPHDERLPADWAPEP